MQALDIRIAELSAQRRRLAARCLQAVRLKERMLRQVLAKQEAKALALNEKLIELDGLQRNVARAKKFSEPFLARSGKLNLASGLNAVPVQIIDRAVEPLTPVKPRKRLILLM